jgi:DNA-binding LacI/PurR family transcriptional regulator
VAVVGHDDLPLAAYADPPLTTIRQPVELLGREMVRLLLHRLGDPDGDPESVVLPTELVVRASA